MLDLLKKYFGYDSLRESQVPVIGSIMKGQDTLAVMPTGGGKSLCYQLPALCKEGLVVVVSPLIALMHDQVSSLKQNGINADFLNSSQSFEEQQEIISNIMGQSRTIKLLYVSPERLMLEGFLELLKKVDIAFFAVDEAHCISSWGHDFRPEYAMLGQIKNFFPSLPIIALTATADDLTRRDIISKLKLNKPNIFISSFDRSNITYLVESKVDGFNQLREFISLREGKCGIVYCLSRKNTEEIAKKLNSIGISAAPYHAGLATAEKNETYEKFITDRIQVVVATIAFGMGIDKPNVRFVVHWNLPKSIESYYQETGRAGRDGLASEAYLLYNASDAAALRKFIENDALSASQDGKLEHLSEEEKITFNKIQHDKLNRLMEFAQTGHCRRRVLLQYFGQKLDQDCGNCDACLSPKPKIEATVICQKAVSTIFKTEQRFGISYIVDILRGQSSDQRVEARGHDKLSTFGIGQDMSDKEWLFYINQMIEIGLISVRYDKYIKTLALNDESYKFIKEGIKIELVQYQAPEPKKLRERTEKSRKSSLLKSSDFFTSIQKELFIELKRIRTDLAIEAKVPPYMVFGDTSLIDMIEKLPETPDEFSQISGVGEHKKQKYGEVFLEVLKNFIKANPDSKAEVLLMRQKSTLSESNSKKEEKGVGSISTYDQTLELWQSLKDINQIAAKRGLNPTTIMGHLENLYIKGKISREEIKLVENEDLTKVIKEQKKLGVNITTLKEWKEHIESLKISNTSEFNYGDLRLSLALSL
jgi:ATP-dependent DNA helicase RecQ